VKVKSAFEAIRPAHLRFCSIKLLLVSLPAPTLDKMIVHPRVTPKFYSTGIRYVYAPGACFSKAPETFRARKAIAKSRTLRLQSWFIHIFLRWREVPFTREVSGMNTSPFLDTDELKMALGARKVYGAFEKQAPGRREELNAKERHVV